MLSVTGSNRGLLASVVDARFAMLTLLPLPPTPPPAAAAAAAAASGVCQPQDFEFLRSVGAEDWVLPQHGVVFAQERRVGSDGPVR